MVQKLQPVPLKGKRGQIYFSYSNFGPCGVEEIEQSCHSPDSSVVRVIQGGCRHA